MGRRGRKRQLDVETRYWQLLASGMGTVEACRRVGITRKTGYRWRAERGGAPPVRLGEDARSNRYLSLLERQRIATLRARGLGVRGMLGTRRLSHWVKSATQTQFGAGAVNSRLTRSAARTPSLPGIVVRLTRPRTAPASPFARIRRSTRQRPTWWPAPCRTFHSWGLRRRPQRRY